MNLHTYSGTQVTTLGAISTSVAYVTPFLPDFQFYIVPRGQSLMGVYLFNALGFYITSATGQEIRSVEPSQRHPLLRKYPNLTSTDTARCIAGFKHKPLIDRNVKPVAEPLRRVPHAYHDKTCKKLDDMERDGI